MYKINKNFNFSLALFSKKIKKVYLNDYTLFPLDFNFSILYCCLNCPNLFTLNFKSIFIKNFTNKPVAKAETSVPSRIPSTT